MTIYNYYHPNRTKKIVNCTSEETYFNFFNNNNYHS
jgi:hypothetical protein